LQDLIKEYRRSLGALRRAKAVPVEYGSMVSDTQYAIEIMETGRIPGTKWTIARWPKADRDIPVDPHNLAKYLSSKRTTVEPLSQNGLDILNDTLKVLTSREREAYFLVRGEMFSFAQAAKYMGCNKGSVQNFVARAEKKIAVVVRKQAICRGTFCG